jgi:RNA-directed DNA polymerase
MTPVPEVGKWLKSVVGGHVRYFGVPGNRYALAHFRFTVSHLWHHVLERRSQKGRVQWERMQRLIHRWLPIGEPSIAAYGIGFRVSR